MDGRTPRSLVQPALILGAGFLWAWFPLPTVSALVWAYLGLVLALGLLRGRGWLGDLRLPWPAALPLALVLAGPFAWALAREGPAMRAHSQLEGIERVFRDRALGLQPAALHPIVVRDDRPQALWIRAEADELDRIRLGADGPTVPVTRIGAGLWRASYDPRVHGRLPADGPLRVTAGAATLAATAVRAGPRPARLTDVPGGGALGVSEETDEILHLDARGRLRRLETLDAPIRALALTATVAVVAHRFAPDLHRRALPSGAALPPWAAGADLVDLAAERGHAAVVARGPDRLQVFGPGPAWQVDLPFTPRRVFASGAPEAWYVEAETEAAVYLVTATDTRRVARLGRPIYDARPLADGCLEAFVPDFRPLGDPGPNHHVADQRVRLCAGRRPRPEETFARDDHGDVIGGAGPHAARRGGGLAFTATDEIALPGAGRRSSPLPSPNGLARLGPEAWAVSSAVAGAIAILDAAGEVREVHRLAAPDTPRRRGERAFFEATRSGAACETCHLDADSDRGHHDIGHPTPRPTLSVRGVAGTAPFLRVASYPDLSGLEHFAQTILGGYARVSATRADDLIAYVESLPPLAARRRLDPEAWRAGWTAFEAAGCPHCHAPPAFTNRAQYPQPMLFPNQPAGVLLDTPSLLGVAASPPYLYDGRAPTLEAIFEDHDPAGRHGRFAELDDVGRAALLRFLEAL